MRKVLRRTGCLLGMLVWLFLLLVPCLMIGLMIRGELVWERGPRTSDRLYLIQAAPEAGVGLSSVRPAPAAQAGLLCTQSIERLWLWKPAGRYDETSTCTCSRLDAGGGEVPAGDCPP